MADVCHRYPVITCKPPPTVPYISHNEPPELVWMLSAIFVMKKTAAAEVIAKVLEVRQNC